MSQKSKLIYIAPEFFPLKKANSLHVINQVTALANKVEEVELVFKSLRGEVFVNFPDNVIQTPIRIKRNNRYSNLIFLVRLLKIRSKFKSTKVLTRSRISIILELFLSGKDKIIFEAHEPIKSFIFKSIIRFTKVKIIVISEALKNIIKSELKLENIPVRVFHDGANILDYNEHSTNRGVTYIGSIGKGRGIDLIYEIAIKLPDIDFNIIGNIDGLKICRFSDCRNLIFHGWLEQKDIQAIALSSAILIAPYQPDLKLDNGLNTLDYMSPLKIFEYMSYEKPIIVSDLPVISEVLTDGVDCLMVNDFINPDEWVQKINILINSPGYSASLGKNAKNNLVSNYTWDIRADNILNYFND